MAHESFEDEEVAALLNRDYISIKVDREERPDIDAVYMSVCQALTGSGGWPLTIVMTAEQRPFWAGTYLPKTARYGRMGLLELLATISEKWNSDRKKLLLAGETITAALHAQKVSNSQLTQPSKALLYRAIQQFKSNYDKRWGGFGLAPKFPAAHNLQFLLRYAVMEQDPSVQDMVEHTLTQMFRGGIFDHIGGGFSRYSTDERWLVPHFEKMLYDNALLVSAYLEAYKLTGRPLYSTVAKRTLDYVLRELTDVQGGFYCGQDADSDGIEGKYYVFTPQEIYQVLDNANAKLFCEPFDIRKEGNFEGKSIPNLIDNQDYEDIEPRMDIIFKELYDYRIKRTHLHKDDKVLTSWNALMIAALAKAGRVLCEPVYLQDALNAQRFIAQHLIDECGRLRLRWRDGESAHAGQLNDYAFYSFALLELYRATFEIQFLKESIDVATQMLKLFWDDVAGGFYLYATDAEQLITRPKEVYDGAMPSGNSVAAMVLGQLSKLTGEIRWQEISDKQFRFLADAIQNYPSGYSVTLLALMEVLYPSQELICVTALHEPPKELTDFLEKHYLSNLTVLVKTPENQQELTQIAPFTSDYPIPISESVYYLCKNGSCSTPVYHLEDLSNQLRSYE